MDRGKVGKELEPARRVTMPDHSLPMTSYLERLECRSYFVEETSSWTEGKKRRPGKTMSTARNEARNLINLLLRSTHWTGAALLADRLAACAPQMPCLSGACPVCNLAAQRAHVGFAGGALSQTLGRMAIATIVDGRGAALVGRLGAHDLYQNFRGKLSNVLAGLGIRALGCFELSQNWDEAEQFRPRYVEQAHFCLPARDIKRTRRALKEVFRSTRGVLRPVRIAQYDRDRRGAAYNSKNSTRKRIALAPNPDCSYSTRWKALGAEGRVEVALAQDAAGLDPNSFACGFGLIEEVGRMRLKGLRSRCPTRP